MARSQLPIVVNQTGLSGADRRALELSAFQAYLDSLLATGRLTQSAEAGIVRVRRALGMDEQTFNTQFKALIPRLFAARANDGRLPVLQHPHLNLVLGPGEVAHIEVNAELVKEVVDNEWRGGYSGLSFRIVKGARYSTGTTRGRSVVVGSHLAVQDRGLLTITSRRAVFTGPHFSIEMPFNKLLNLVNYADGVQFHLSSRKDPPLFRMQPEIAEAVSAAVTACMRRSP
jgi:hypothetical protein